MRLTPARIAALALLLTVTVPALAQSPAVIPGKAKGPTVIDAESIEGVSEIEVTARGRAELRRDDVNVFGEFLRYNQEFGRIEADGGVRMEKGLDRFSGPRLRYNTVTETGVFEQPNYLLRGEVSDMRGGGERLEFLGGGRYRMLRASFTSCQPGREDWRFEARELELDRERSVATVRDARFRFLDTTLLALPHGSFALDHQRKSGVLVPQYAQNTRRGAEFGLPLYWNIAPERDLTLIPSVMTKRGAQLKTEYRYMSATSLGEMRFEHMPKDKILQDKRSGFTFQHQDQVTPNVFGRIDLNKVTDHRYFVDLSSHVRQSSIGNLNQQVFMQYSGYFLPDMNYYLQGQVQRFQTLQDPLAPITPPYHRLPQLNFSTAKGDIAGVFDFGLQSEFVRFTHPTMVEGTRLSMNPSIAAPILAPGYFLTPKLGLRYVDYNLRETGSSQLDRPGMAVPWASVDGGLIFDRSARLFGQSYTQTLEPRLFYVYAPFRDQRQLPLFDTTLADFNYAQLFSENRFAGGDRFGDANQITLAATSRILSGSGAELLRATVGQRYYMKDERVALNATTPLRTRDESDLIASVGGRVTRALSFDTTMQYNQHDDRMQRFTVGARFAPEVAKVVSASYRFNRDVVKDVVKQIDVAGQWPLQPGWYAIGRVNYSIQDKRMLESIGGIEYNAGCWVFRAAVQRLQAAVDTTATGFFFQLEFNGMGSLGSDEIVTMLKRNVPGYVVTNPTDGRFVPPSLRPPLPFAQTY